MTICPSDVPHVRPYGENVLVRMCAPPATVGSLIVRPDSADECIGTGPEFKFSGKGTAALVLAVGSDVVELVPGDLVLVDKLAGEPIAETAGDAENRELRIIREPAVVAVLEVSHGS
jgi:hypothetical protein